MVLTKRWGRPVPLLTFTGWQLAFGGLLLLPVTFAVEGLPDRLTLTNVGGFLYLALLGTVLGYALWFRGPERLPAASVSFLGLLSPAVATVAGWVVLGQALNGWQALGMVLALGGLVAGQRAQRPVVRPARARPRASRGDAVAGGVTAPRGGRVETAQVGHGRSLQHGPVRREARTVQRAVP